MNKDSYVTFIGAKGVAFAWIGAAIGPVFLAIGLDEAYRGHLAIGIVSLILVALSIRDGIKAFNHGSISNFSVFAIVPTCLLVAGIVFAWLSGAGSGG